MRNAMCHRCSHNNIQLSPTSRIVQNETLYCLIVTSLLSLLDSIMYKATRYTKKIISRRLSTISADSKTITFNANDYAQSTAGSCTCTLGDTTVLVTAVSDESKKPSSFSFVPLTVDYKQEAASLGRMDNFRREILTSRMIDRSIRTGFVKGFNNETQVVCDVTAVDEHNHPDILAINGASASLSISDIPWFGPIGAVRIGLIGENYVINPTTHERENSRLNMVVTANKLGNVVMLDGSCKEPVLMNDILQSLKRGIKECQIVIERIDKLSKSIGKPKRILDLSHMPNEEQKNLVISLSEQGIRKILSNYEFDKASRDRAMEGVRMEVLDKMKENYPDMDSSAFAEAFSYAVKIIYKKLMKETYTRCDGRKFTQIRNLNCKVDLHKPLHGSAIFKRGQTQVFCSTTFDSPDAVSGFEEKNFILQYEFPPYATNEVGRMTNLPGRREIGHGALAEKSIRPMVSEQNDMTVRLKCKVYESNGSSSMASVCAGSLSLMDAGLNIKEHVAGVAMGLISDLGEMALDKSSKTSIKEEEYLLLTDILGFEDYIGDMDFKIAGTRKAITAIQLDVKPMFGIPLSILHRAIQRAHTARAEIIRTMESVIREPRKEKKESHPVIKTIYVPPHKRAKFIGSGGVNVKKLEARIGVRVFYDESYDETGTTIGDAPRDNYTIFAPNKDKMQKAEDIIKALLEKDRKEPELEYNGIYTATIQEIRPNGVMVTLYPDMMPALLHLTQLDIRMVNHPDALNLEVGQKIQVKYFGRDPATGQMRLSRKSLMMTAAPRVHREYEPVVR